MAGNRRRKQDNSGVHAFLYVLVVLVLLCGMGYLFYYSRSQANERQEYIRELESKEAATKDVVQVTVPAEPESETISEAESSTPEAQTETQTETQTEIESESETEKVTEKETKKETEKATEKETETESESETEKETEALYRDVTYYAKPMWKINCLYVSNPRAKLAETASYTDDERNSLDYLQLLVDAQTGELIGESSAKDRAEFKGFLSWEDVKQN